MFCESLACRSSCVQAARKEAYRVAIAVTPMIQRLFGFELDLGVALADRLVLVFARIVVDLHVGVRIALGGVGVAQ